MAKASTERVSDEELAELNDAMKFFDSFMMEEEEMQEERKERER